MWVWVWSLGAGICQRQVQVLCATIKVVQDLAADEVFAPFRQCQQLHAEILFAHLRGMASGHHNRRFVVGAFIVHVGGPHDVLRRETRGRRTMVVMVVLRLRLLLERWELLVWLRWCWHPGRWRRRRKRSHTKCRPQSDSGGGNWGTRHGTTTKNNDKQNKRNNVF